MITHPLKSVNAWVDYFDQAEIPVLARTEQALVELKQNEDNLNGHDMADTIQHDPLMTLKVLRYLHAHHSKRQSKDITTMARALMMLGTTPFFRHFAHLPTIDQKLAEYPDALRRLLRGMSLARHAALYAQDWATARNDIEADEIVLAALLRNLGEILMSCFAPTLVLAIHALMRADPHLRSSEAQRKILGFPGLELQLALVERWHLPPLLRQLMNERDHAQHPRTQNVALAHRLARHAANGWQDAGLPDDYRDIAQLLRITEDEAWHRILRITLSAAKSWSWYGVPPLAARLPQLPVPQRL